MAARKTLKQRIALDGGKEIEEAFGKIGRSGKKAFAGLEKSAKGFEGPAKRLSDAIKRLRGDMRRLRGSVKRVGDGFRKFDAIRAPPTLDLSIRGKNLGIVSDVAPDCFFLSLKTKPAGTLASCADPEIFNILLHCLGSFRSKRPLPPFGVLPCRSYDRAFLGMTWP